jgi:hypothetical protein
VKKTTKVTVLSTLFFSLALAPAITTQAATLPFLSSIFDTIQGYVSIANTILAGSRPSTEELGASVNTVLDERIYGVTRADTGLVPFTPFNAEGEINFDTTADDLLVSKLTDKATIKTRSIREFQSVSELATFGTTARSVGKVASRADGYNTTVVNNARTAITQAGDIVSSQPIGTCDSSLCAENTNNTLIAEQINLQSAAISLAIMGNTYSKINNNQQAILVKNEQDKKAQEVVKARFDSVTGGSGLRNRVNANQLIRRKY